jgi:hypothetical protein
VRLVYIREAGCPPGGHGVIMGVIMQLCATMIHEGK